MINTTLPAISTAIANVGGSSVQAPASDTVEQLRCAKEAVHSLLRGLHAAGNLGGNPHVMAAMGLLKTRFPTEDIQAMFAKDSLEDFLG